MANLTKAEATARLCKLMTRVNKAVFDFENASDCICGPGIDGPMGKYENDGAIIEWMELAIAYALRENKTKVWPPRCPWSAFDDPMLIRLTPNE